MKTKVWVIILSVAAGDAKVHLTLLQLMMMMWIEPNTQQGNERAAIRVRSSWWRWVGGFAVALALTLFLSFGASTLYRYQFTVEATDSCSLAKQPPMRSIDGGGCGSDHHCSPKKSVNF